MLFSYTNPCFNPRVPNLRTISSFTSALPKFYARVEHQGDKHLRQAQRLQDSLPGTRHHTDASGCPAEKSNVFSRKSNYILPQVAEKVKGVSDLLKRCLKGLAQNADDAIHSMIWSRCPKHKFVCRKAACGGSYRHYFWYIYQSQHSLRTLSECGCAVGDTIINLGLRCDRECLIRAEKSETNEAKQRRVG
ncbi:hypothetical protein RRG08_012186 [Elysia crispata]|uniref:Uncharacterized protein n=1 Tax=Elysia crispata TaxID=231223 RepID=A0AAE1DHX6_9GAST|nr:hypothetical protein RRG08_012186 [Elysia crispata]